MSFFSIDGPNYSMFEGATVDGAEISTRFENDSQVNSETRDVQVSFQAPEDASGELVARYEGWYLGENETVETTADLSALPELTTD